VATEGRARSEHGATGGDPRSLFAGGRALVSVIGNDGSSAEREVKVGVMNRVAAQITAGLEPGEQIVAGIRSPAAPPRAGGSITPNAGQGTHP
jgi:hypothetical protein